MKLCIAIFLALIGTAFGAGATDPQPLEVVPVVDLARYAGTWYEVARFPNRFQQKCLGEVTATYSQLSGNEVKVINACRVKNGQITKAEGKARLADAKGPNSKLKVRFAPSFLSWLPVVWGDYWIIDLAQDYSYAVVGSPDRKYLWVLSRTPQLTDAAYEQITRRVGAQGFETSRLVKTSQTN
jgi:apolipoprotein D and lipocalin family protein